MAVICLRPLYGGEILELLRVIDTLVHLQSLGCGEDQVCHPVTSYVNKGVPMLSFQRSSFGCFKIFLLIWAFTSFRENINCSVSGTVHSQEVRDGVLVVIAR